MIQEGSMGMVFKFKELGDNEKVEKALLHYPKALKIKIKSLCRAQ